MAPSSAAVLVSDAFARGLEPDPNLPVDEWSDEFMIIPKDSGANEYGKYRTGRTPHARKVMKSLSDNNPCKRVVVMGASQMLKTQVALNFFACSVHQSPSNFLWVAPTGKLQKRTSSRVSKTIAAVPELKERVAAPRSRDSVNTMDTKEYIGGSLNIVTAGAAANLSEIAVRRAVFDEIDRAERNVNKEGSPRALVEARQTTYERNRKTYYPSSPTIDGESEIQTLYEMGTQEEALAECVHCGHPQTLVFERLAWDDDGQNAVYPCIACHEKLYEHDKNKMFEGGLWSEGVPGDGETDSYTINALFLPYGWFPWSGLLREYAAAKKQMDAGSDELMITFYNTRLARCWARAKEQTKYDDLMNRAEPYKLGTVPAGGLTLTGAIDTQNARVELKVVAWGEGMEGWIIDYQIIHSSPDEDATWEKVDEMLRVRYRHAYGQTLPIEAVLIDSGGNHTQDVYNYTSTKRRRNIFAIKGASRPNRPIISAKPKLVDINWRGKSEKSGAQLWFIGTDTAKDHLASRWKRATGPGAIHFSNELPEEYFKQLTAEFRTSGYKGGRRVSWWDIKQGDRNEAGDLMVYNLAAAHFLGLHKRTENHWQRLREKLNPNQHDLLAVLGDADPILVTREGKPVELAAAPSTVALPAPNGKLVDGLISLAALRKRKR